MPRAKCAPSDRLRPPQNALFKPDPRVIRKRIEDLIVVRHGRPGVLYITSLPDGPPARAQREYLERDKDDMQKFRCAFL